jgi:olfactory receptor
MYGTALFSFALLLSAICWQPWHMIDMQLSVIAVQWHHVSKDRLCTGDGVYIMAIFGAMTHSTWVIRLFFYGNNVIQHYLCDILPLLKLYCSSIHLSELLVILVGGFNVLAKPVPIAISYAFILTNILWIPTAKGRSKAFGTCGSHFTAVGVFYGSIIFTYIKPASSINMVREKVASVLYTSVIPMLNPLIYSLRSKNVERCWAKSWGRSMDHSRVSGQNHEKSWWSFVPFSFYLTSLYVS